jgi:hypothetical protein
MDRCACDASNAGGTVIGHGPYAAESSLCEAAVHAGAIPWTGGDIAPRRAPACKFYPASMAYGVTSVAGGPSGGSFFFPGFTAETCAAPGTIGACPERLAGLAADGELTCACPENPSGSVWGSGVYTTDSDLCTAALHAGLITAGGGKIRAKMTGGCANYPSTTAHAITSQAWGAFGASFYFPDRGDGACPKPQESAGIPESEIIPCPDTYQAMPRWREVESITCDCNDEAGGTIYGARIYTTDSSLCLAAIHAGAVTPSGGKVTAVKAPGCAKYPGVVAHGVKSTAWESFDSSFYFRGHHDGTCP